MSIISTLVKRLDEALDYLVERQQFSSAATSLNQVPRSLPQLDKEGLWGGVKSALDLGAGKYDAARLYLAKRGVKLHNYDPYNRTDKENKAALNSGKHDVVLLNNVLNVIKERTEREDLIKLAKSRLSPNGQLIIQVYQGTNDGQAKQTGSDQFQLNQPLSFYEPELKKHFGHVEINSGLLRAKLS
jgi:hypothetical protein